MLKKCIELGGPVLDLRSQTVISTIIENVASVIAIPDQTALDSGIWCQLNLNESRTLPETRAPQRCTKGANFPVCRQGVRWHMVPLL